ncbi:MAG TPA: apolipoprotein N-acyltransferase [Propionibacteriaceae bacterium]|nr:apolipoprotein N-acyltransferase [Propionibacteriaceae bacterium]
MLGSLRPRLGHQPWFGAALAFAGGCLTGLGYAPVSSWLAAMVGVASLSVAVKGRTGRSGLGLGYLFGLGLGVTTITWVSVLGSWVAVVLVAFMALWSGLLGWGLTRVMRLPAWPVWAAACWGAVEFAQGRVPFGGFGWNRLAYAMVDSPLDGWLGVVGVPGTSVLAALVANLGVWAVGVRTWKAVVALAGVVTIVGAGALVGRVPLAAATGSVDVGVVQGDVVGQAGVSAMGYARSVTNNHLAETITLMTSVRLGEGPEPEFLLLPENSTDIDPANDPITARRLNQAVTLSGVPLLVGAVTDGPGVDERQTTSIWWSSDGPGATRHKLDLVPFGEWIPFRAQLLPVLPILKEVGAQSGPGTEPPVLAVDRPSGRHLDIGIAICFELAFDETMREALIAAPDIMVVQSNNATYTGTAQPYQQFVITRARAREARREILVSTTSSLSGLVHADGTVDHPTEEGGPASFSTTLSTRDTVSWGTRLSPWVAWASVAVAGAAILLARLARTRGRASSAG